MRETIETIVRKGEDKQFTKLSVTRAAKETARERERKGQKSAIVEV